MSQVRNLISKVHGAQLKVVAKGHDGLLKAVDQLSQLQGKFATSRKPSGVSVTLASVIGGRPSFCGTGGSKRRRLGQAQRVVSEQAGVCHRCEDPLYSGEVPDGRAFLEPA